VIGNILAWLILGALAGWLANYIMTKNTNLDWVDLVLGIVGAIVGGFIGNLVIPGDLNKFSPLWIVFAVVGALIVAFVYKYFTKKSVQ
jgi:uncharacterized membrane protein YeaQ/YmgE (transglycosylase-associated protein family)